MKCLATSIFNLTPRWTCMLLGTGYRDHCGSVAEIPGFYPGSPTHQPEVFIVLWDPHLHCSVLLLSHL